MVAKRRCRRVRSKVYWGRCALCGGEVWASRESKMCSEHLRENWRLKGDLVSGNLRGRIPDSGDGVA